MTTETVERRGVAAAGDMTRLNAICPYYTMFPLSFPLSVLQTLGTKPRVLADPFCGRGTTAFAARLHGVATIGADSNPLAAVLSASKLVAVTAESVKKELAALLRKSGAAVEVPQGEFWQWAFAPRTLRTICALRRVLCRPSDNPNRIALRALVAGALHGPRNKGTPSYLSNQAPRTFGPKPEYAVRFWKAAQMRPLEVDLAAVIGERADRYYSYTPPPVPHHIALADSRSFDWQVLNQPIDLAITSPPYWRMKTYGADQWLRLWWLGAEPRVDYSVEDQLSHNTQAQFARDLTAVWKRLRRACNATSRLVIRFGIIPSAPVDAYALLSQSLDDSGWRIDSCIDAGSARSGKRQCEHFTRGESNPAREFDAWCSLKA